MKLTEVGTPFDKQLHDKQLAWLNTQLGTTPWHLMDDGTVYVEGDVRVSVRNGRQITRLPVQFGHVSGNFNASKIGLQSLYGTPYKVDGDIDLRYNPVTTLEGLRMQDCMILMLPSTIQSLKGIRQAVRSAEWIECDHINDSVLGLLMIRGLRGVTMQPTSVERIITEAIDNKTDVHIVQDCLIESGLESYARM